VFNFFCSCQHEYHVKKYYDSGEMKHKYVYANKNDTSNYLYYGYYKNGNYKKKVNVINGKKEGHFINYYDNGKIKEIYSFKDNLFHGPWKRYDKQGTIEDESFFFNGQYFLYIDYLYNRSYIGIAVYRNTDQNQGALELISLLNFKNGEIMKDSSDYYYTYTEDTIPYKKANNFKVECYNEGKSGYHVKLVLGELNKNLKFIDSTKTKIFESNDMTIQVPYKPVKKGVDLLTGKLYLINDSTGKQEREFLYYHEFYVK